MRVAIQYALKIAISIFIVLCFISKTYAQNDLRIIGVLGSFSIYPAKGEIPKSISSYHKVTVDSNSIIVIEKTQANAKYKAYFIIGPRATFTIAKSSKIKEIISDDSSVWKNVIETIKIGGLQPRVIKTTLREIAIHRILLKNGFKVGNYSRFGTKSQRC